MHITLNPFRDTYRLTVDGLSAKSFTDDVRAVQKLLFRCPEHRETPLIKNRSIAREIGIQTLWVKDA